VPEENEKDPRREVNPAMRHDPPRRVPPADERKEPPEQVEATQGAELDPRDQGGIAE
jgi:hypothetical protein